MANETEQDLYSMNLDDLRELANQEARGQTSQPRNEHGQFVATEEGGEVVEEGTEGEGLEEPAVQQPPVPMVHRRTIDLGDGSGAQVFEGASLDELADKLADAQKHATRKIRELSSQRKQEERETADNDFMLGQELLTKPSSTVRKLFEDMVGMPIESFKTKVQKVEAFEKAESARTAAKDFVQSTEDYYDVEANGKKIGRYLDLNKWEWTVENMQKAYRELSADGLLVQRPVAVSSVENNASAAQPRIAETATRQPVQKRVASSGLTTRGRSVTPPAKKQFTEAELYSMPEDQLRDLANQELRGSNDSSGISY